MHEFLLSPRLQLVADLVAPGARFVDVGTDHAFLPVWLIRRGILKEAIASDLRQGPLERARQTAERYQVSQQISFRLCDGLKGILPEEVDTISIAGMGGETIAAILEAAPWTREGHKKLLLQPMSSQQDLRTWLQENGYRVDLEHLAQEGRRIYITMEVTAGTTLPLTAGERWAGRQWQGMKCPLREPLLSEMIRRAERAQAGLRQSGRPEDIARRMEMERAAAELREMREQWNIWQQS